MRKVGNQSQRSRYRYFHGEGERIATLRKINYLGREMIQIDAPYSKDWTATLESSVQKHHKFFDPGDKFWYVRESQFDKICLIMEKYFDDVVLVGFESRDACPTTWATLWLLPGAPQELVKTSYRVLASLYHPDKGGSNEAMAELNEAYHELMRDFAENGEEKGGE